MIEKKTVNAITYAVPFMLIPLGLYMLSHLSGLVSIPLLMMGVYAATKIMEIVLMDGDRWKLMESPIMTAIPQATLLCVFLTWISIFRGTF
jgi:hypothetical protein